MAAPKRYLTKDPKTGQRVPSNLPKASMDSGNLPVKAAKTAAGGSGAKPPVKTNRDPLTKSYLASGNASKAPALATPAMKKGGAVKAKSSGRGDGIASKGKTKCKYV